MGGWVGGRVLSIKEGMFPEREKMGAMQQTCAVASLAESGRWSAGRRSIASNGRALVRCARGVDVGWWILVFFFFFGKIQKKKNSAPFELLGGQLIELNPKPSVDDAACVAGGCELNSKVSSATLDNLKIAAFSLLGLTARLWPLC